LGETLAICRTLALARAFEVAIKEKPAGRFMIRGRVRIVQRDPRRASMSTALPHIGP